MANKLVIVGGVAGGATAAARARRLDEKAEIVVLERGEHVSFANCGLPYHVGGEIPSRGALLLQTPESLNARYALDVRTRSEVLKIDRAKREVEVRDLTNQRVYRESYDKLILSPGAAPLRPPLPGIDHKLIFTLRTVPDAERIKAAVDAGARTAVVVGGGFIGLEMAENFRRRNLDVHVVELLDQVMPPLDPEMATPLHQTLRAHGVDLHLGDAVERFTAEGQHVVAHLKSGDALQADLIVLAVGVRPESKLASEADLECTPRGAIITDEHMRTSDPNIYAVGDAVAVRDWVTDQAVLIPLAGPANRQGRIAADNALGRSSTYRGTQGTSVVRVFNLTAAMTGASEKTLRKSDVDYEKIYVHPAQHVGYFPGASPMTIKLLFAKPDGKVLGAQIVGGEGVDKRIDVLATALQARMTVYDLEALELAYAPQYGSAKDPVNMAGFVAANVLRGDDEIVHADEIDGIGTDKIDKTDKTDKIDDSCLLIDVREPGEHAAGHIPNSTLIPLSKLRTQPPPQGQPIVVYCQAGLRGYVAARQLRQCGYQVRNLSGGYKTYCMLRESKPSTGIVGVG